VSVILGGASRKKVRLELEHLGERFLGSSTAPSWSI
jgi:hypothetical protein